MPIPLENQAEVSSGGRGQLGLRRDQRDNGPAQAHNVLEPIGLLCTSFEEHWAAINEALIVRA